MQLWFVSRLRENTVSQITHVFSRHEGILDACSSSSRVVAIPGGRHALPLAALCDHSPALAALPN